MKRSSLLAVLLILILAGAAYLVLQRPGERSVSFENGETLVQYDSSAIDRMTINGPRGSVAIEKQAGKWMLVEPLKYPADPAAVATAIGKGTTIRLAGLISSNPAKQKLFEVDSTATLVTMYDHGNEKAAFRVGKPGSSFSETYVRAEGSQDVYLTPEVLTFTFAKNVKDWRDKAICTVDRASVHSIAYRYGDTTFSLTRTDTLWQIDGVPVNDQAVTSLLAALASFQADDFVDSAVTAPPRLTAAMEIDGIQIRFHENTSTKRYFVQASLSPQWFELQPWRAQQVLKRKSDLLPY